MCVLGELAVAVGCWGVGGVVPDGLGYFGGVGVGWLEVEVCGDGLGELFVVDGCVVGVGEDELAAVG